VVDGCRMCNVVGNFGGDAFDGSMLDKIYVVAALSVSIVYCMVHESITPNSFLHVSA
jgi:hypothetical protein